MVDAGVVDAGVVAAGVDAVAAGSAFLVDRFLAVVLEAASAVPTPPAIKSTTNPIQKIGFLRTWTISGL